jgi:ubiquinone/menaquinone biosynthesis C-methylase UbiE
MNVQDRYEEERRFTDASAEKVLATLPNDCEVTNVGSFEGLCDTVQYLRSVPEFTGSLDGKKVLEMGCGDGWISLRFAGSGAKVWAVDLSPKMIELAQRYAQAAKLDMTFETMNCEQLTYDDESFDFVFMHMALHHCDITAIAEQVHRVLKPEGKVVFIEDYAYHPLMNLYRRFTPEKHTQDEHPLTSEEVSNLTSRFSSHSLEYSGLLNILETENNKFVRPLKPVVRWLDDFLYAHCGWLNKYSRIVVIKATK